MASRKDGKLRDAARARYGWTIRRIDGVGSISASGLLVLEALLDGEAHRLDEANRHTVTALERRDWIVGVEFPDGVRHCITGRGRTACRAFLMPVKKYRYDGICPACEDNPKVAGHDYCAHCWREYDRARSARGIHREGPCPRCGENLRATGRVYCRECAAVLSREYYRRQHGPLKVRRDGICPRCNTRPRVHPPGKARRAYCRVCERQIAREHQQKRRAAIDEWRANNGGD